MENNNYRRLITSLNLLSNLIPYFGYTDQCYLLLNSLCKSTSSLWNEKTFLTIILKSNRRLLKLNSHVYENPKSLKTALKLYKVILSDLDNEGCKLLYNALFFIPKAIELDSESNKLLSSEVDWSLTQIDKIDFISKKPDKGIWHLLLLRKLVS